VVSILPVYSLRRNCAHDEFTMYCNPSAGQILGGRLQNISSTVLNLNQHSPVQYYGFPTTVILPACKSWTAVVNYLPILLLFTACFIHTHTHTYIHTYIHTYQFASWTHLYKARFTKYYSSLKWKQWSRGDKTKNSASAKWWWLFTLLVPSGVVMQNVVPFVPWIWQQISYNEMFQVS